MIDFLDIACYDSQVAETNATWVWKNF